MHEEGPISTRHISLKSSIKSELASLELDGPPEHFTLSLQQILTYSAEN